MRRAQRLAGGRAPRRRPVCSTVAAMVSVNDFADRPPRALADGEELSLGRQARALARRPAPASRLGVRLPVRDDDADAALRRSVHRTAAPTCPPLSTVGACSGRRWRMHAAVPYLVQRAATSAPRCSRSSPRPSRATLGADARQLLPGTTADRRSARWPMHSAADSASRGGRPALTRPCGASRPGSRRWRGGGRPVARCPGDEGRGVRRRAARGHRPWWRGAPRGRARAVPPVRAAHPALRPAPPPGRGARPRPGPDGPARRAPGRARGQGREPEQLVRFVLGTCRNAALRLREIDRRAEPATDEVRWSLLPGRRRHGTR